MANISRVLTGGEIAMLRSVFGGGITYASVRVHNFKRFFFQPDNTAMTPNGEIYFPPAHYAADFSAANLSNRAWFVHEGAHLYQHYGLGWNVYVRGATDRDYNYTLDPTKTKLSDYGLEQMGDIAQDFYTLRQGGAIRRPYTLLNYAALLPIP
jgi:hypothetical protein